MRRLPAIQRPLTPADLPASARIHVAAFPHAAISQLGVATAERYHASLRARADVHATAAFTADRLAGFCFGGTARDVEGAFLREHLGFVARELLRRPSLLVRRVIRARIGAGLRFLRPRSRREPALALASAPASAPAPPSFTILYLAVHPDVEGRGVAHQLLAAAESHARAAGFAQMDLSVYLDNTRAIAFYERHGWQRLVQDGAWQGFMFKPLG
ncbi:MAG: GNAT family N-acetyltransferase [Opitutae bacterium]|nr:GNAT family N-acetyltransferase [Opitutae bacterium]